MKDFITITMGTLKKYHLFKGSFIICKVDYKNGELTEQDVEEITVEFETLRLKFLDELRRRYATRGKVTDSYGGYHAEIAGNTEEIRD